MSRLLVAVTLVALCTSSPAATITATLTATDPIVFLGLPGSSVQVPATTITFTAIGDTAAIYSYRPGAYAFNAPIEVNIPGVASFVSDSTGSHVSTESSSAFPGIFRFGLRSIPGPGAQSVYMVEPSVGGYDFRSDLAPLPVLAVSTVNLPLGGVLSFTLPDGRALGVDLNAAPGTLRVDVNNDQATASPTDLDTAFGDGGIARIVGAVTLDDGAMYPDGGLAVVINATRGGDNRVLRLDSLGRVDPSFTAVRPQPATFGTQFIDAVAITVDGRTVTRQFVNRFPGCDVWLTRHLSSGAMDEAFGQLGVSRVFQGGRCSIGPNLALSTAGEAYFSIFTGSTIAPGANTSRVVRVGAAGTPGDELVLSSQWSYEAIAVQGDGRPVVTLGELGVMRLFGTVPDSGFGTNGIAVANTVEASRAHDVAIAHDGRVVVAGIGNAGGVPQFVLTRFTNDGRVDLTFGAGGVAYIEAARADERVISARVALQSDGKIVVAGTVEKPLGGGVAFPRIAVARLTVNGLPDALFAPGGIADLWWQGGAGLSFLLVRPDGRIVIGAGILISFAGGQLQTEGAVVQLLGGDDSVARPLRERKAVEYFHAGYGHYFLTADAEEIALLDTTAASGWTRTGRTTRMWDDDDPTLKPVCRFWSNQTWAPKSSHFYTPYDDECANVKNNPAWYFERNAFKVRMPEGPLGARTCVGGSSPLYRAYNNGQGGAPNHRYTTDPALLDEMIAGGWTMEGEASTRVFACVPGE